MKKRTLIAGALLASIAHASDQDASFLEAHTGPKQTAMSELCLKVQTYSIYSMTPEGGVGYPFGLQVAAETSVAELVVAPSREGQCEKGYIKIVTSAPLISVTNAPVGL